MRSAARGGTVHNGPDEEVRSLVYTNEGRLHLKKDMELFFFLPDSIETAGCTRFLKNLVVINTAYSFTSLINANIK